MVWEENEERQETETGTWTSASPTTARSEDLEKAPGGQRQGSLRSPGCGPSPGAPRPSPRLHEVYAAPPGPQRAPQDHSGLPRTVTAPKAEPWPGLTQHRRGSQPGKLGSRARPSHTPRRRKCPEADGCAPTATQSPPAGALPGLRRAGERPPATLACRSLTL